MNPTPLLRMGTIEDMVLMHMVSVCVFGGKEEMLQHHTPKGSLKRPPVEIPISAQPKIPSGIRLVRTLALNASATGGS